MFVSFASVAIGVGIDNKQPDINDVSIVSCEKMKEVAVDELMSCEVNFYRDPVLEEIEALLALPGGKVVHFPATPGEGLSQPACGNAVRHFLEQIDQFSEFREVGENEFFRKS